MQRLRLSSENSFALSWLLPFTLLGASTTYHHEMWRDEMQAWLIALSSSSLAELLHHVAREVTPGAWYLMLMVLTRFTDRPEAMQVLHLAVASTVAYLVLRLAPFTRLQRVLLVFGYFFSYEYLAIARSYSLTALCLFVACAAWTRPKRMPGLTVAALLVLSQSNLFGLILALAFAAGMVTERLLLVRGSSRGSRIALVGAIGVVMLGVAVAAWQLRQPLINAVSGGWTWWSGERGAVDALGLFAEVFIPIPRAWTHFWTSSWLWGGSFPRLQVTVSSLVLIYSLASTARRPAAIVSYVSATAILVLICYGRHWGVIRHHGMIFLAFVAAAWIAQEPWRGGDEPRWWSVSRPARSVILTVLLAAHVVGAGIAIWWEHRIVFSQGRAVAEYIRQEGLVDENIVAYKDYAACTVSGYLRGKEMYYVQGNKRFGTFTIWGVKGRNDPMRISTLTSAMKDLENTSGKRSLLLLNQRTPQKRLAQWGLQMIKAFAGPTAVSNEIYFLYRLSGSRSQGGARPSS